MTTANKITVGRILLAPVFIWQILAYARTGQEWHRWAALLVFAAASLGDGLDGYVARHYNQRTQLGAVLDPLADKILLIAAILILTVERLLPVWLIAIILGRDLIILAGMILVRKRAGRVRVRAHLTGKTATVFQMATVLWILLGWNRAVAPVLAAAAAGLTALSAPFYILDGVRQFYFHRGGAMAFKEG
jgi:CDP-diacylglycerol--glycerol-3-phosphate 3-phosphatidyltransferase